MPITIDATYENGVLKPAEALPLAEHAQVRVTVEEASIAGDENAEAIVEGSTLMERLIARGKALPEEVLARLPHDGASQHDHYIYGTPKRKDLPG